MVEHITLRVVTEPFVYDVVAISFSIIGLFSGIFCLYAVVSERLHSNFMLVLVHTTALLLATLSQVFVWPALEYTSHKNVTCHVFKFLEYSARVVVNNSSAAMMFWYMLFNRSMYFDKGAVNLRKLNHEAYIYFVGSTIIAGVILSGYFYQVSGSFIVGHVYCFSAAFFGGQTSKRFLIDICLYAPLYIPLGLGMMWFLLGRSKWKLEASEITGPIESVIAGIHRLFYWLTWSAILTQSPIFVLDIIQPKGHSLQIVSALAIHLTSIQNAIDAVAFYVILLKPVVGQKFDKRWSQYQSSEFEIGNTMTLEETSAAITLNNTNDLSESFLD